MAALPSSGFLGLGRGIVGRL